MKFQPSHHSYARNNPPPGVQSISIPWTVGGPSYDEISTQSEAEMAQELNERLDAQSKTVFGMVGVGLVGMAALLIVPPFVIGPFIVKAFKPEWSYGRRLGTSLGVSFAVGAVTGLAGALSGKGD